MNNIPTNNVSGSHNFRMKSAPFPYESCQGMYEKYYPYAKGYTDFWARIYSLEEWCKLPRCGDCMFWNRDHITCIGYAKCLFKHPSLPQRISHEYYDICDYEKWDTEEDQRPTNNQTSEAELAAIRESATRRTSWQHETR